MAVGFAVQSGGVQYNGRMTPFVILSCMAAAMGGVIFGYDIGISGGVTSMEPFLRKFFPEVYKKMKEDSSISNYCKFDSQLLTSFTSSLYIAGLVASFFASTVTRAFGRKPSIVTGGVAFLAGTALGAAALNIYMLIIGRLLLGIGVGFANQSVPLYLSEMSPPKYRGAFNNGFQFSIGIGALSANLINYGTEKIPAGYGWRISLAMAAVPASLLTLGALFLPETPNSLIQQDDNHHKALKMLQKVRGTEDVQAELEDLIKANAVAKTVKHPFRNIFRRTYRPQLVMAIAIPFFQQVTGINVIAFYAPLLFRTIGLGESASLMSAVVTGLVGTGSTFVSMLLVDRLGRRTLFMVGGIQMFVSQLAIGAIMAAQLGDYGGLSTGYAYLVLILISIYVAGFGWSWGPLGWLVPSEIFQLEIRSAGQGITVAVSFVFTFVVAQTFLSMLCHLKWGIFLFFGGWVAIMTGFVYLLLPETRNIPIELMDRVWMEHWFWKSIIIATEKEIKGRSPCLCRWEGAEV
ncbi:hexose carrier protein HEX6-like [Aristolochia californica]|uniref:hexose carrier protein HEX6-like n=1 Tax=Aristolochia californica TaxID=171875 RepID=UPI0035DB4499